MGMENRSVVSRDMSKGLDRKGIRKFLVAMDEHGDYPAVHICQNSALYTKKG